MLPAIIFVTLYSLLPHKELRFLFPSLPLFNGAAAVAIAAIMAPPNQPSTNVNHDNNKKNDDVKTAASPSVSSSSSSSHDGLRQRAKITDSKSAAPSSSTSTPSPVQSRESSNGVCLPSSVLIGAWLATCMVIAIIFLYISSLNYPGGDALAQFHHIAINDTIASTNNTNAANNNNGTLPLVHIDNWAAMTGASRWAELRHQFR